MLYVLTAIARCQPGLTSPLASACAAISVADSDCSGADWTIVLDVERVRRLLACVLRRLRLGCTAMAGTHHWP